MLDAPAYGQYREADNKPALGTTEACAQGLILILASFAGGLGARCAPNGEREGQSPLAASRKMQPPPGSARRNRLAWMYALQQRAQCSAQPHHHSQGLRHAKLLSCGYPT